MSLAVARAVRSARLPAQDAAAVTLAKRYAEEMDAAALVAGAAAALWEDLAVGDEDGRKRLAALERQLEAVALLSDLGPKLLAVLTALGLTLAGRPAAKGVTASGAPTDPAAAALAAQRARAAAARANRATHMDSPAP